MRALAALGTATLATECARLAAAAAREPQTVRDERLTVRGPRAPRA